MTKQLKKSLYLIIALLALVAIIVSIAPQFAFASTQEDKYARYFSGGDGSESNPYLISNETELRHITDTQELGSDGYSYIKANFKLLNDITLSTNPWVPIGGYLKGTIDGNNKTIRNMIIRYSDTNNEGIWEGFVGKIENGTVKNLNFDNATVTDGVYSDGASFGVVAGLNHGFITNCTVTNSTVSASINNTCYVGGICGSVYFGRVENCTSYATVTGNGAVGGISGGVLFNGSIRNSTNYGTVTGYGSIGGIAGEVSSSIISHCNNGSNTSKGVTVSLLYNGSNGNAGGIVGEAKNDSLIEECKNYGLVKYGGAKNDNKSFKPCIAQVVGLSNKSTVEYCSCFGSTDFTNLKKFFLGPDQKEYCKNDVIGRTI